MVLSVICIPQKTLLACYGKIHHPQPTGHDVLCRLYNLLNNFDYYTLSLGTICPLR